MHPLEEAIAACREVLRVEPGVFVSARFFFDSRFIGFSGHFPGYPLLPAFVQIAGAARLIRDTMGLKGLDGILEKAKFLMEIHPGKTIRMDCTRLPETGEERWKVEIRAQEALAAAFQLIFQASPEDLRKKGGAANLETTESQDDQTLFPEGG
ncbi:MAG: hypothetical protein JRI76_04975 [Deltaproteobacteria bacterium]|nr:hypothetical protein [Deltaproteobacteria bacterium]MBW1955090.1 hypothetical protein [Deltaproteobacteria bacterium]MBW2041370.1 hypothetical protein [Deltaproteobacteria bacterium]MBW2131524.1 hypothetical protein [Deltaproteobacteria bacterium]